MAKKSKVITRRKKFINVEIPIIRQDIELLGNSIEDLKGRTIKLDLTRQLKGKSIEAVVKIDIIDKKAIANPKQIRLMPYFIRRMIRKRISYVEDSFLVKSQESLMKIKPFMITRKRVSRAVRRTLRNKAKNWIEDYINARTDSEIFSEILANKIQKPLSLSLKKTYPLSLCEIRALELIRPLNPEEVPEIKIKPIKEKLVAEEDEVIDQLQEIEDEKIKKAQEEIKKAQEKAIKKETEDNKEKELDLEKTSDKEDKKIEKKATKKTVKKAVKKTVKETVKKTVKKTSKKDSA